MENLWKELLAYVKKKTVVKKVLEYVEKDILLKNVLKCIPRLVVSFMVIGFIAEVCASGIKYFSRPVRQDLYEHIPDIHIYGTDTLLCDELTITARISDRAFSSSCMGRRGQVYNVGINPRHRCQAVPKGKDATMTKFPLFIKTAQNIKRPQIPPIMPLVPYEEAVGYERIKGGYKQALRGRRKYTREAVKYDLFREKNNVDLWRELKSSKYTPGPYHFNVITEPKRRDLSIPQLRDKVVQLVIHEELQNMFRPVFINGSFACQYGRGPIRAAFKVQHDMRVARMKWGDNAAIIKIDARKFFYSIDRALLKKILAKRFKKLKKKRPETYEDLLRFYRLLCKVIDSSPEGETGIPLGNVSSPP